MSKLSKEEISARRKRMQGEALKAVAKTEQLNIRIDETSITRLYALAGKEGKPVGTMVREWILDRLRNEEQPGSSAALEELVELVSKLHARIDRWDAVLLSAPTKLVGENKGVAYKLNEKKSKSKTRTGR